VLPRPDHVVVVIEENHSLSEIIGPADAPYINSLAQQGALMTASTGVEHTSQPNYLDLFSGSNQGTTGLLLLLLVLPPPVRLLLLVGVRAAAVGFLFLLFPDEAGQLVEAIRRWAARM